MALDLERQQTTLDIVWQAGTTQLPKNCVHDDRMEASRRKKKME